MFSFLTSKITIIVGVAFLLVIGAFYWYYRDSQATIADYAAQNASLQIAVQTNEAAIESMKFDQARQIQISKELQERFDASRLIISDLTEKLKDLSTRATADPDATDDLVNSTMRNINNCFEILSGTPATALGMSPEIYNATKQACLGN